MNLVINLLTDALGGMPQKLVEILGKLHGGVELDDEANRLKLQLVEPLGVHLLGTVDDSNGK